MKRFLILIILITTFLSGCSYEENAVMSRANNSVTTDNFDMVVTEYYDGEQDLIQRIEYNKNTKITIVYTYHWDRSGLSKLCKRIAITTIDVNGEIISSSDNEIK